jgi:hypothetical protein
LSLVQTKHNKAQVKFTCVNCGRAVRIPADAIERFIERNTIPAKEERLKPPARLRLPEIHRAPGEFDDLPDELPDPSVGWIENPERIDRSRGREVTRPRHRRTHKTFGRIGLR